jgi:ankyrin repeat protein
MFASMRGFFEIAKFLIENGADVNIQSRVFFFFWIFLLLLFNG